MFQPYKLTGTICDASGKEYTFCSYVMAESLEEATQRAEEMSSSRRPLSPKFHTVELYSPLKPERAP
jgi:hypothetical protein